MNSDLGNNLVGKVPPAYYPDKVNDRYIIAIGASAGGLEAIHEFFDHMPANSGFTFVVIQHLSPDYKSLLVELVSKHTHMKVFEATNDTALQRDCVYIIPNKKLMTIKGHKLKLADKVQDKSPNTAIDTFLFTLAKDKRDKAIAIILSGTGTDGTKGAEAIKECGGMVIVQDPSTAKFDGMPNSAITSGNADFVLPPSKMHVEVYNYVNQKQLPAPDEKNFNDNDLNEIFALVHNSSGQDFNLYKTPTILRRIARRMANVEVKKINEYVDYLRNNPAEVKTLAKDFLIGVTKFFRDKPAFDILAKDIIPSIVKHKKDGDMLKVWICACSTGEEAYSIAVLINDHLSMVDKSLEVKIFATDVDEASIELAGKNTFPSTIVKEVDSSLLKKYFVKNGKTYSVLPSIRKQIVFATHNVIKSPPFIKNDLVSCRNMLIYMNTLLQQKVVATFHYALNKDGYLFLGSSENTANIKEGLTEISSKWKIFQKSGSINYGLHHTYTSVSPNLRYIDKKPLNKLNEPIKTMDEEFRDLIMDEFKSVGVFIDRSYIIKETIGNYTEYLILPEKKLDLNILNMVPRDVAIMLNTAIRKAWKENKKTHLNKIRLKGRNNEVVLKITVKPPESKNGNGYTLILFSEGKTDDFVIKDGVPHHHVTGQHEEYLMEMEAELTETRANLQMAIEEMETTNEELQSSNEELLSANEELQSGNEELQSLNEELHTLNTEHQAKIRELTELNDDLDNYFRSTDIGQLFIDAQLRIRKFNPAAVQMINLIESDVGRPIAHISNNIQYDNLINDIHMVLANGHNVEKEVQLKSGINILMRIMPYIRKDKKRDGVVISFVDISAITELGNIITGVFNATSSAILAFKEVKNAQQKIVDFKCISYNQAALSLMEKSSADIDRQPKLKNFPLLIKAFNIDQYISITEKNKVLQSEIEVSPGKWYQLIAVKMPEGLVASFSDMTDRKTSEQKLRKNYNELIQAREQLRELNQGLEQKITERTRELTESEERFKLVSEATNDTIWDWNLVDNTMWRSDNFEQMFGYKRSKVNETIDFWFEKIHPEDRARVQQSVYDAINSHSQKWSAEYRFLKADGKYATVLDRGSISEDEFHTPYRLVGSVIDVTRLTETEQRLSDTEYKFRKIFDSNMIGMIFSNLEGDITDANDAFLKMLGYERSDLHDHPLRWTDITPKEYLSISYWAVEQLTKNGTCPPFEKQYYRKSGEQVPVLMGSAVFMENNQQIVVSYIIDLTQQKAAEKRRAELQQLIKKQQDEFYRIFTNAPALINIKRGPDLTYEFVNKAFEEYDGNIRYIGRKSVEVHGEETDISRVEKKVYMTGETYQSKAFLTNRKSAVGNTREDCWLDFIVTPVFDDKNKIDGTAFFGFDVTDIVRSRQATEELMHKKDEFMSIASHELKTPITTLKGSLGILQRLTQKNEPPDKFMPFVDKAGKQTDKLITLVNDLLDVTKIQAGKMAFDMTVFNMTEMVAECVDDAQLQADTHKIIFEDKEALFVKGDKIRLEQVLGNFISNAIKYSPSSNRIIVRCFSAGDEMKVTVQDFGIGVPKNKKDFLFDRFYRVQTSSSHFSGLGLGLYISAEIVKRHQGNIGVESVEGSGSTFWFTLPLLT